MAEQLRINVEVVEIEVNDNGDIIKLPVSDELFIKKLSKYSEQITEKSDTLSVIDTNDIIATVNADIEFHEFLKSGFNEVFGERAYEKVFGEDIVVGAEYIFEFLEAVMPYLKRHTENRAKKLSKYSADRVGSSL